MSGLSFCLKKPPPSYHARKRTARFLTYSLFRDNDSISSPSLFAKRKEQSLENQPLETDHDQIRIPSPVDGNFHAHRLPTAWERSNGCPADGDRRRRSLRGRKTTYFEQHCPRTYGLHWSLLPHPFRTKGRGVAGVIDRILRFLRGPTIHRDGDFARPGAETERLLRQRLGDSPSRDKRITRSPAINARRRPLERSALFYS